MSIRGFQGSTPEFELGRGLSRLLSPVPSPPNPPRDPLHGITLESIITQMVERHGWAEMGARIPIRCFRDNPSVKSALTFLRKTPWARERLEGWFIHEHWSR